MTIRTNSPKIYYARNEFLCKGDREMADIHENSNQMCTDKKAPRKSVTVFWSIVFLISLILLIFCVFKYSEYKGKIAYQEYKISSITAIDVPSRIDDFNSKYEDLKLLYENNDAYEAEESSDDLQALKNARDEIIDGISAYQTICEDDVYFDIASISGCYDDIINELYEWRSFVANRNYLSENPFESVSTSSALLLEFESWLRQYLLPLNTLESDLNKELDNYKHSQMLVVICLIVLSVLCTVSLIIVLIKVRKDKTTLSEGELV